MKLCVKSIIADKFVGELSSTDISKSRFTAYQTTDTRLLPA